MFKNRKIPHWIFLYVSAILLVACAVNGLMYLAIPTLPDLSAPSWLDFWGGYLGGAIGCLPALAALYDNRREARRQHEESETSRRLATMPVISCENNSSSFSLNQVDSLLTLSGMILLDMASGFHNFFSPADPKKYVEYLDLIDDSYSGFVFIDFQNIGLGPALNVSITCSNSQQKRPLLMKSIGSNETRSLLLCIQIPHDADDNYLVQYDIEIEFSDIFGNQYVQVQPLMCRKKQHAISDISIPTLV